MKKSSFLLLILATAWAGLYLWSEQEALHWNKDIRMLTAEDWKGIVRSMHHLGMDIIVIQELFRNQKYVHAHDMTAETYPGVFNDPSFHPQVGEESSLRLSTDYAAYKEYMDWQKPYSLPPGAIVAGVGHDSTTSGLYPFGCK
ncbi:MAG: hypothetical protein IJ795_08140 [Bacteroidales bacterium]|nr:hypothetical protein [Bacteroidales bacterium]